MKILQKIYAVWAISSLILSGVVTSVLLIPGLLIPSRRSRLEYNRRLLWGWSAFWGMVAFIRFRSIGRPKGQKAEPTIFVANHTSYLDPPVAYTQIRQPFRTLAKQELTKIPFYARIVKSSCILIDRKDAQSREKGFQQMLEALDQGESILIYPEGTQNRTGQPLKDFYEGAFRLAIQSQCPIQVIACQNAGRLLPNSHMMKIRPGTITYHWLSKIPTQGMTDQNIPQLMEEVRTMLWDKIAAWKSE